MNKIFKLGFEEINEELGFIEDIINNINSQSFEADQLLLKQAIAKITWRMMVLNDHNNGELVPQ